MAKFMKLIFALGISFLFTACYENETIIIDENEEDNLRATDELTNLMKSVTSHNSSFDDHIDNSHCFSIAFPYKIIVNEDVITINSVEDVQNLDEDETDFQIVYPISINLTNFEVHNISTNNELNELKQMCDDGWLYGEHIDCADFVYPLTLATYNTERRRFDKVELYSNKETFQFLDELDSDSIFEIVYPANIFMFQENYFSIENNFSLNTHFKIAHNSCGVRD